MKTNRIKYIFIGLLPLLANLYSCKDLLDYQSPSRLNLEQTFESPEYTDAEILSIYNKVAGRSAFGNNLAFTFPMGADDFSAKGAANFDVTNNYAISNYGVSGANNALFDTFTQLYAGIERANIACKYIPASNLYRSGSASQKKLMGRYYGEALALRALFYHQLIINWGDVPATFVPAADLESQFLTHSNRDSTYDRIIEDLRIASELVEWPSELTTYGTFRLTKTAIKGLRARIALARGGYSLRNNVIERKSDYAKFYEIAVNECNDIIKNNYHHLNPVYEDIFKSLHSGTVRYDNAHELIFEVAMWGSINDSDLARSNGIRFNNSTTWGTDGGGATAVPTYYYEFENGKDVRRDATLGNYEVIANDMKQQVSLTTMTNAKFRKSWTQFNRSSPNTTYGVNWPLLRFADILLMYAEAANEINFTTGVITPMAALEMVQKRAYGTNPITSAPTGKDELFTAIRKERLLEFGGEGLRKYDLIRWNKLAETFTHVRAQFPLMAVGAPATDNPWDNLPDFVYSKAVAFGNKESAVEASTINLYGGAPGVVYFTKNSVVPAGYTRLYWRREIGLYNGTVLTSDFLNNTNTGYVCKFEPNKKELLPYPNRVIIENRGAIKQNFGY